MDGSRCMIVLIVIVWSVIAKARRGEEGVKIRPRRRGGSLNLP